MRSCMLRIDWAAFSVGKAQRNLAVCKKEQASKIFSRSRAGHDPVACAGPLTNRMRFIQDGRIPARQNKLV